MPFVSSEACFHKHVYIQFHRDVLVMLNEPESTFPMTTEFTDLSAKMMLVFNDLVRLAMVLTASRYHNYRSEFWLQCSERLKKTLFLQLCPLRSQDICLEYLQF